MEIVLDRIDFYSEELHIDGEDRIAMLPSYVDVDYFAKIGRRWLRGTLGNIPYNYYVNLGHEGLINKINEGLQQ